MSCEVAVQLSSSFDNLFPGSLALFCNIEPHSYSVGPTVLLAFFQGCGVVLLHCQLAA
jgi:hypothetical protein